MKTKHRLIGYVLVGITVLVLFLVAQRYLPNVQQFASPQFVRDYLIGLGNWGYFIYILLFILSIPLPIPSMPLAIGAGYVYGFFMGLTLTMIGVIAGASIAFQLSRYFGEPLLEKVVSKHHIIHFNHIFKKRGVNGAIIAYAIPIFPADSVNFILGISTIRYHQFLLAVILGSIPRYVIVTALGQELLTGFTIKTIIVPIVAVVFVFIALFRERIKKVVFKELRFIEHEVEKEVEWVEEEVGMREKTKKSKGQKKKS